MHCEQAETFLAALIYGQLDSKRKAALLEHMATCMKCSALLAGMRSVSGVLKEAIESGEPPKLSRQRRATLLRVVAARKRRDAAATGPRTISKKIKSIFSTLTGPMRLRHLGGMAAVLALVIVAAGFLLPTVGRARHQAKHTLDLANQRNLGKVLEAPLSTARKKAPDPGVTADLDDWGRGRTPPPAKKPKSQQQLMIPDPCGSLSAGSSISWGGTPSPGDVPAANAEAEARAWKLARGGRGRPPAARKPITAPAEGRIVVKHLQDKYSQVLKDHDKEILITNGGLSTGAGTTITNGSTGGGKEAARTIEGEGGRNTIVYRSDKLIVTAPPAVKAEIERLQSAQLAKRDSKALYEEKAGEYFKALPDDLAAKTPAPGGQSNEKAAEGLVPRLGLKAGQGTLTLGKLVREQAEPETMLPEVGVVPDPLRRKTETDKTESDSPVTLHGNGEAKKSDRDLARKTEELGALQEAQLNRTISKRGPTPPGETGEEKLKARGELIDDKAPGHAGDATIAKAPPPRSDADDYRKADINQDGRVNVLDKIRVRNRIGGDARLFGPAPTAEPPPAKPKGKKSGGFFGFLKKKGPARFTAPTIPPLPAGRGDAMQTTIVEAPPQGGRGDEYGTPATDAPWQQEAADGIWDVGMSNVTSTGVLVKPRSLEGEHNQGIAELVKDRDKAADKGRAAESDDGPAFVRLTPEEAQREDDRKLTEAAVDADRQGKEESIESDLELVVEEELPEDEPMPPAVFKLVPVNPFVMTQKDRFSTFALDVDTASYALARSYIRRGYLPPAGSVRMEEFVNAFDYNYPKHTESVFTVHAEGMPSPFGRGLALLKIGVQGRALGREGRKPAHLVFVIDSSGSMARPDRLPLVQHGLALLAEQLGDRDRVSLVTFGSGANLLLQGVPAADGQQILAAVNSIRCGGSTNLLQGVELGYAVAAREFRAGEINRVILCSDGVANIGLTDADDMLEKVEAFKSQGISFTSIGFGTGSYNDELLEKLANKGDGTYAFIASRSEARRVFVEQMATLQTIAGDAKIQVEFDPARVRRYRLIGYENRDVADKDFRNDAIDAGEVGSGQSATALYELELLRPAAGCLPSDLGTVYVRYRNLDTNKVEEISSRLESSLIRQRTALAAPRLYLAAAAAEFAEVLRESEHARGGSFDGVRSIVERVAVALPLDQRVADLLDLATRAKGLPRAQ